MTNKEIFDAIEKLQYVPDKQKKTNKWDFDSQEDIDLAEKTYNFITKRLYIKFNARCSSCCRETFIIFQNWKDRELKKAEVEKAIADAYSGEKVDGKVVDMSEVEFTPEVAEQAIAEPIAEETKPIQKPKSNGRKRK